MPDLEPITRPDGRPYRPRKIVARPVIDGDDLVSGIIVFGTHDPARAQELADSSAAAWVDYGYVATAPEAGWWRDGFSSGERIWVDDPVHGRAGVFFREIVEAPHA